MLDGYQKLVQEMVDDAQKAWQKISDLASRYGKYGAMTLGLMPIGNLSSTTVKSEQLASYIVQLEQNEEKLEQKLSQRDSSNIKTPLRAQNKVYTDWNNVSSEPAWIKVKEPSTKEKAKEKSEKMVEGKVIPQMTIEELMSQGGITKADIQAVINENPSMLHEFTGGETNRKLAKAANNIKDPTVGKCTKGVQNIYCKAGMGDMIAANNPNWPAKERGAQGSNSACNLYIPLERSGEFITVTVENKAYKRGVGYSINSKENKEMNDFVRSLPTGTTICIDNKADEFIGRKMPTDNQGWIHGHTGVINERHNMACDFEQVNGVNFGRYGQEVKISLAKDVTVNEDFITKCMEKKLEREQKLTQIEQNKIATNLSR